MWRAGLALALALLASPAVAQDSWALRDGAFVADGAVRLTQPTDRYAHDVLGGIPMFSRLEAGDCAGCAVDLPAELVFEDVAPRLWDADGDGQPEIVVVESHVAEGARLAIWSVDAQGPRRRAETPFIGQPQRWMAVAGLGDYDGDGRPEIAYVDRPHLARELVFVRLEGDQLVEIARASGFSNHQIGETTVSSATQPCAGRDTLFLPDATHARILAVTLTAGRIVAQDAGGNQGPGQQFRCAK
jgi:FG-GAP-like repeat